MHQRSTRISTQGVLACMAVVLLLQATSCVAKDHLTGCKIGYDRNMYAHLESLCVDCYKVYPDKKLQYSCRDYCFTTKYFSSCLDTMSLTSNLKQVISWVNELNGAAPDF